MFFEQAYHPLIKSPLLRNPDLSSVTYPASPLVPSHKLSQLLQLQYEQHYDSDEHDPSDVLL